MSGKSKEEIADLVATLKNPEVLAAVDELRAKNSRDSVMEKLYDFFEARLEAFKDDDEMQKVVVAKLMEKLRTANSAEELTFSQLLKLYEISRGLANTQTRNIVEIVKPVPNAESPILPKATSEDAAGRINISLPADKAAAVDRIMRTVMQGGGTREASAIDVTPTP